MKHGPIALIDQFMPVIVIAPMSDPTYAKIAKSPRYCIIANPPTFNRRCCRIRAVVQFLVASRAEDTEAGLDKLDPRTGSHFLTKSPRCCMIANPPTVSPSTSPSSPDKPEALQYVKTRHIPPSNSQSGSNQLKMGDA